VTARLLPGAPVAEAVLADLRPRIARLVEAGHRPGLGTVLVGGDSASGGYVAMKMAKAEELGMTSPHVHLPDERSQADLVAAIRSMNDDPAVDAMLVQHPTPKHIDFEARCSRWTPTRTSTGCTRSTWAGSRSACRDRSRARPPASRRCSPTTASRSRARRSASSAAAPRSGGRWRCCSRRSGPTANAAVTVVHTGVPDWAAYTRRAAIVVAAVGVPGILRPEHIAPGATVVGGGVRYEGRRLLPDVDEACNEVAGAITPRVGGVGPTTVAMLFQNCVEAAERSAGL
jgi:methylenetetrahydrofolate dehydrogenase (NADP+)/methenyltetrahydrofolate cyclohydrolase